MRRGLTRAALDTKLIREVQSGAADSNQNSHEVAVAVVESGQLSRDGQDCCK